jgi:hypothetical protein
MVVNIFPIEISCSWRKDIENYWVIPFPVIRFSKHAFLRIFFLKFVFQFSFMGFIHKD